MNRLVKKMADLQAQKRKAFIVYLMAGEPSWPACAEIILALERAGVAAVELGVPFSDPIADGPVIQAAANRALAGGVTLRSIFSQVKKIREKTEVPILLMGYWNVFLKYGKEKVLQDASLSGIDGFIIADLPPEAGYGFFAAAKERELCTILLASELSSPERLRVIAETSTGFIYYVPQTGVTGLELAVTEAVKTRIEEIKSMTPLPVCIGIGIKTPAEAASINEVADGVIVGTRIVDFIETNRNEERLGALVGDFVKEFIGPDH